MLTRPTTDGEIPIQVRKWDTLYTILFDKTKFHDIYDDICKREFILLLFCSIWVRIFGCECVDTAAFTSIRLNWKVKFLILNRICVPALESIIDYCRLLPITEHTQATVHTRTGYSG